MPRIILTKADDTIQSSIDKNSTTKREGTNSDCMDESSTCSKKTKYESISASMIKMNIIDENNKQKVCNNEYLVPPNKDTNGFAKTFPQRLMDMISYKGSEGIIAWTEEGTAFNIISETELSKKLLPLFFKKTKFLSFIRKINRWGFKRVLTGENTGAFYHECFLRDEPQRCLYMDCHHSPSMSTSKEAGKDSSDAVVKTNTAQKTDSTVPLPSTFLPKNTNLPFQFLPKYSPQHPILNEINRAKLMAAKNVNKVDSFDAHTRRILSNSVLAKSQYLDRFQIRNQLLTKRMTQNPFALGSLSALTKPHLHPMMPGNKKAYTAHDIAAAKLLLSSRKQGGKDGVHFLANKLPTNIPRKQNTMAAKLA